MQEQQIKQPSYYQQIVADYERAMTLLEQLKKGKEENANRNSEEV